MNVTEAVDLLSIAARSSTWNATPADAAALLEVVRGTERERDAMGAELADRYDAKQEVQNLRAEVERLRRDFDVRAVVERCPKHDAPTLVDGYQKGRVRTSCPECLDDETTNLRAEVERLRSAMRDTAARQREACAEAMRPILRSMLSRGKAADLCRATPLVTDGPTPYAAGSRLEAKQARDLAVLKGRVLDLEERLGLPLSTFTDLDGPVAHEGARR